MSGATPPSPKPAAKKLNRSQTRRLERDAKKAATAAAAPKEAAPAGPRFVIERLVPSGAETIVESIFANTDNVSYAEVVYHLLALAVTLQKTPLVVVQTRAQITAAQKRQAVASSSPAGRMFVRTGSLVLLSDAAVDVIGKELSERGWVDGGALPPEMGRQPCAYNLDPDAFRAKWVTDEPLPKKSAADVAKPPEAAPTAPTQDAP